MISHEHVSEAVVLSTCNRTEVYVVAEKFHPAYADLRSFFADLAFAPPEEIADHLYVHDGAEAIEHLFRVASGVDSAVVGEAEILGQVRHAWEQAQAESATGSQINLLFRHALEVGKRVRTDTEIGRHIASVSTAAVAMAAQELGELEVDLLMTGTGAQSMILEHADLARVMAARDGRPILVVDVAVPRDVDPAAAELPGVTLLDMDDLRRFAEAGLAERRREVASVHAIIDEEVERFSAVSTAREVAPLVSALHAHGEAVRSAELDRLRARLGDLDARQIEAVEALTKGIVAKLLHEPTIALKDAAGTPKGERLADALRDLFEL